MRTQLPIAMSQQISLTLKYHETSHCRKIKQHWTALKLILYYEMQNLKLIDAHFHEWLQVVSRQNLSFISFHLESGLIFVESVD
jgi:hypothetical protein